ncbi:MAG: endonuclease domain-containing protein [Anaerolineae bacterium]
MPRNTRGKTSAPIVRLARGQRHEPTPAEERLWSGLRGRRLGGLKFRRQHPYGRFILDAYCVEHKLVVEVDGAVHDDPDQAAYDCARTECLLADGIRVIRFKNREVMDNLDKVLQEIREAALGAASPPGPLS